METRNIETAIEQAHKGIAQYLEIMELWPSVNVVQNRDFQRKFNAFYRVRQRPADWYATYYGCMQECRKVLPMPTFDDVLDHLWRTMGRCEPSFSSKLVATLDPHQPVWDTFVLRCTGVKSPTHATKDRVAKVKAAYRELQQWYRYFPDLSDVVAAVTPTFRSWSHSNATLARLCSIA